MSEDRRVLDTYRAASESADERPRAETRAAILAAAARALQAPPRPLEGQRPARSRIAASRKALALAASVLVGAIALTLAVRTDDPVPVAPEQSIAEPTPLPSTPPVNEPRTVTGPVAAPVPETGPSAAPHVSAAIAAKDEVAKPEVRVAASPAAAARSDERVIARPVERSAPVDGALEDDPQRWLQRIVALRAAGRDDEADEELKRLRSRHPDVEVPAAALRRTEAR